jgi:competence protein ComGF
LENISQSQQSSRTSLVKCLLTLLSLILIGSIGTVFYAKEKRDQSTYKPTMCFVENYSLVESKCQKQECHSGFINACQTNYYTCNLNAYTVIYNVSDGRITQTKTR